MDTRYNGHAGKKKLTQSAKDHGNTAWRGVSRGDFDFTSEGREGAGRTGGQAHAWRWEAVCYAPEWDRRHLVNRSQAVKALQGERKSLLYVIHEVPLERVRKERFHDQICRLERSLWSLGGEWILLSVVKTHTLSCHWVWQLLTGLQEWVGQEGKSLR